MDIDDDIIFVREKLIRELSNLADHCTMEASFLRRRGEERTVNSLGIIQGRGLDVDLLCARLETLRDIKRKMLDKAPSV